MIGKKLINPEELDALTAEMRKEFSPKYFIQLYAEFPKETVKKYFGSKQEPGVASALWRDDPKKYLRCKMAGVYRDLIPNQLHRNLRLSGTQLNNLHKSEPNDVPISDNEQFKERLR